MTNLLSLTFEGGKRLVDGNDLNKIIQAVNEVGTDDGTFLNETVISTVGNGILTAAGLVGGSINRSGPTGAYTDTTDTAVNIIKSLGAFVLGSTFKFIIKNTTLFGQTIAPGTGITLPGTVYNPPLSFIMYFATIGGTQSAPAITFTHRYTGGIHTPGSFVSPLNTPLTTVGAGTILAAGISGGVTLRGGTQIAAFTDTSDTAANIITLLSQGSSILGQSQFYTYTNNTIFPATISGGTNCTVSGVTIVPANSWVKYLVTFTAAGTVTMVGIEQGYFPSFGTYVNNGASAVTVANTAVTANSIISFTLKTVGGTVSASAPNVKTITPGTGFTVAGLASDTSTYSYEIRG